MLVVSKPEAINYFTISRLILWILSVSRNPILTHLPPSRSLNVLPCNLIAPSPCLTFFLPMTRTLAAASSFLSGRAYPCLNFLPFFSLLDPYCDYVGVNISINNSSLSFLNVYALRIRSSLSDSKIDFFFPFIRPSSRHLFILGHFNCHHSI